MNNNTLHKSFSLKSTRDSLKSKNKIYRFTMTKETPDRQLEIVEVKGIDYKDFLNNPIVLFDHDQKYPIGKVVKIDVKNDEMIGYIEFHKKTEKSREIADLVEGGYLNTVSVGFIPYEIKSEQRRKDVKDATRRITKSELVELSVVAIPSNRDALRIKSASNKLKKILLKINGENNMSSEIKTKEEDVVQETEETVDVTEQINLIDEAIDVLLDTIDAIEGLDTEGTDDHVEFVESIVEDLDELAVEIEEEAGIDEESSKRLRKSRKKRSRRTREKRIKRTNRFDVSMRDDLIKNLKIMLG